ncbi:helix-turn-helix domain-containing protein [Streptomyces roseoverticillatus]|uniref:helix-turn-helix domain-containing protein n=1 Tax=Streptomyces roseoverticillatus TaxID=66429 RepID=UPI001F2C1E4D|nr:helix-turn-helix domain-containing protein [Streptomyces roseoverticillatus]MCF3100466.1 helix-turn-helix domain-containing protein [Streptomyces roseoverticillatus]
MSTADVCPDQLLYTVEDATAVLRLGRSTVYELMAAGVIKYVTQGRARRVHRVDLEAYAASLRALPN